MRLCAVVVASLVFASVAAGADQIRPKQNVNAQSVPGSGQSCTDTTTPCIIIVRVTSDCLAIVDIDSVKLKKNVTVHFMLVRSDMTDTQTYHFESPGLVWNTTIPPTNEIAFNPPVTNTVAEWKAGNKKSNQDYGYFPLVRRDSDNQVCSTGDPKIANDG